MIGKAFNAVLLSMKVVFNHVSRALAFAHGLMLLTLSFPLPLKADPSSNAAFAVDQTVRSIAVQPDGKILISGDFTNVQGAARGHVARLNADGSTDFTFMNGLAGANLEVDMVSVQSNRQFLVGGLFSSINGSSRKGLALLNFDGTVAMSFNAATGSAPFMVQADGKLLASTALLGSSGTQDIIYRLNTNGALDTTWTCSTGQGTVLSMALQVDNKLIIGGDFDSVNGVTRSAIARVNTNGSTDSAFLNGMSGITGLVNALALQPDGKVLIGGYFFFVNGMSRTRIARLNTDGSLDTGFQNGMAGADGEVEAFALQPDGKILIAGFFRSVNNVPRSGVARLNPDGSLDMTYQNGMAGTGSGVLACALQPDGKMLIGGAFTSFNGVPRYRIARLNTDGSLDELFHNGGPPAPTLTNFGVQSNHFAFQINAFSNQLLVIEASTNLAVWQPLATNQIGTNSTTFTDPRPASGFRLYRARSP
jgi:uncharacterized delta-60 repeat protein